MAMEAHKHIVEQYGEPRLAIDAILEYGETGKTIKPLTVARYGLLSLLDSPFLKKHSEESDFTLFAIVPTWYVMTAETKDLRGYDSRNLDLLRQRAFEKADTVTDPKVITDFTVEFVRYLADLMKIAPDSPALKDGETKSKKAPTAS